MAKGLINSQHGLVSSEIFALVPSAFVYWWQDAGVHSLCGRHSYWTVRAYRRNPVRVINKRVRLIDNVSTEMSNDGKGHQGA